MSIKLIRIDDRLIHGQIVEAWLPHLEADQIVVADDEISRDPLKKRIAEISTPPNIKVVIRPVAEAVAYLRESQSSPSSPATIVLFASVAAVARAIDLGLPVTELNLGNIHYEHGKTQVSDSISLDNREVELLDEIAGRGVKIFIQPVPKLPARDFFACLSKKCICPSHRKV
jgi:PTS system mannose-specific IIB component